MRADISPVTTGKTQNADGQGLRRRPNVGAVGVDPEQASSKKFFSFGYADGLAVGVWIFYFFLG